MVMGMVGMGTGTCWGCVDLHRGASSISART